LGLLSGFQEGFKRLPILWEHPDKPYPISHLGIACIHGGGDQDGSIDGKLQIHISPDWEWENCLDVAAAQAQIGSIATNPPAARSNCRARVSLYFDRHTKFYASVFATVIPVAVAHGLGLLCGVHILTQQLRQNHFLPSRRMREVKARPSKALKVRNCGELMSLLTTIGLP